MPAEPVGTAGGATWVGAPSPAATGLAALLSATTGAVVESVTRVEDADPVALETGRLEPGGVCDVLDGAVGMTCATVGTATGALLVADTACLVSGPGLDGAAAAADWAWLGGTVEAADPRVDAMTLACEAASTTGAVSAAGGWAATGGAAAFVGGDGAATGRATAGAEAGLPGGFADGALLSDGGVELAPVVVGACGSVFAGAALAAATATGGLGVVFAAPVAGAGEATPEAAAVAGGAGCLLEVVTARGRALDGAAAGAAAEITVGAALAGDADFAVDGAVEEVGAGTDEGG